VDHVYSRIYGIFESKYVLARILWDNLEISRVRTDVASVFFWIDVFLDKRSPSHILAMLLFGAIMPIFRNTLTLLIGIKTQLL